MRRKKPPKRRAYDTDLSDGQWALIEPMIPLAEVGGRPRKATARDLVDAILYVLRAGAAACSEPPKNAKLILMPEPRPA